MVAAKLRVLITILKIALSIDRHTGQVISHKKFLLFMYFILQMIHFYSQNLTHKKHIDNSDNIEKIRIKIYENREINKGKQQIISADNGRSNVTKRGYFSVE